VMMVEGVVEGVVWEVQLGEGGIQKANVPLAGRKG